MWTENGSQGGMVGDVRHWLDDRLQTTVGLISASVNLEFHGFGEDAALNNEPIPYKLKPVGAGARARYRLGRSPVWIGLGYAYAETKVEFEPPDGAERAEDLRLDTRVGGLLPSVSYDSRDNIFTPTRGTYAELSAGVFSPALGGDGVFQRAGLIAIQYASLLPGVTLGLRGDANLSLGDVPFYMCPYISLRGVPVMRYQGNQVAQGELETQWQFWRRISLVGFAGYGAAWIDLKDLERSVAVATGGAGLRYELARKYGVHAGVDVAFGPDGAAIYIQFGSAWARP
jgi:outer membrane protein assembly factor BamA